MFGNEIIQNLNELELSLYEYIMKNSEKVMYMKIRDLAKEVHVSTTTVIRFCRKVGCSGFTEFKVKFKLFMEEKQKTKVSEDSSIIMDNMKRLMSEEFKEKINELSQMINNNSNVVFMGGGLSGIVGKYASRYISSIGKFTMYIDDLFYPTNTEICKDALVIVISESGETVEIINAINRLKKQKCIIASITNSENSTIAKMSDFNISYYIPQERIGDIDITSHIPVIYILEMIGKRLYNERNNK